MHHAVALHGGALVDHKTQLDAEVLFRLLADMLLQRHRRAENAQFNPAAMDCGCFSGSAHGF
jgi:hypothetical protein